jgi:hypothetical protein
MVVDQEMKRKEKSKVFSGLLLWCNGIMVDNFMICYLGKLLKGVFCK